MLAFHDGFGHVSKLGLSIQDLCQNHSAGVCVDKNGDMEYYVNGQNKGVVLHKLPQHEDLWGVVIPFPGAEVQSEFHLGGYCCMWIHANSSAFVINVVFSLRYLKADFVSNVQYILFQISTCIKYIILCCVCVCV